MTERTANERLCRLVDELGDDAPIADELVNVFRYGVDAEPPVRRLDFAILPPDVRARVCVVVVGSLRLLGSPWGEIVTFFGVMGLPLPFERGKR